MFIRLLGALLFYNLASISHAGTPCDQLAALEADPLSVSIPVKFADLNYDTLRKWASIFTKSVMLVHYGYYRLNRYDMKIYKNSDKSIKLTKHSSELTKIFYQNFKIKASDIRIEGNKLR